jgi:hypothetical protein
LNPLAERTCFSQVPYKPRLLAQAGAVGGIPGYVIYYLMYYESAEWQLLPSLLAVMIIQGFSCFTTSLCCNTLVVTSVAEADLANTQAVWRMTQTVFQMVAVAVGLYPIVTFEKQLPNMIANLV